LGKGEKKSFVQALKSIVERGRGGRNLWWVGELGSGLPIPTTDVVSTSLCIRPAATTIWILSKSPTPPQDASITAEIARIQWFLARAETERVVPRWERKTTTSVVARSASTPT
jgi:hypothetical protein